MDYFVLKVGGQEIGAPAGVPTGGFDIASTKIIPVLIQSAFVFGALLSLLFVMWAGLDWIMSGGTKEGLQKARGKLIFAVIGMGIVMTSLLMVNFLGFSLGVNYFKPS